MRESFFEGGVFTTLGELNQRAWNWRDTVAHQRPWPDDSGKTVAQASDEVGRGVLETLLVFGCDPVAHVGGEAGGAAR